MKLAWKILLPLVVLAGGAVVAMFVFVSRPVAETVDRDVAAPLVRAEPVLRGRRTLTVYGQGTVRPRSEIDLVPEVSGRVVHVADDLVAGGSFEAGEELLRIDPRDYELALRRAEAEMAQARVAVEREEAEADLAEKEWRSLGRGRPSPLALRVPQLAEARARVAAARAVRDQAKLAVERTSIKAPFRGRVRSETVGLGQFVTVGTSLGKLYAVDIAEVRVPVPDGELAYLAGSPSSAGFVGAAAGVTAHFSGGDRRWEGRLLRSEGEVDPETRMVVLVVGVSDPYGTAEAPVEVPLAMGVFAQVEIRGRVLDDVYTLPRVAMRGRDTAVLVDTENRLRLRPVEVLRFEGEQVLVTSGPQPGDRVLLSVLEVAVDGMAVRVAEAPEGAS